MELVWSYMGLLWSIFFFTETRKELWSSETCLEWLENVCQPQRDLGMWQSKMGTSNRTDDPWAPMVQSWRFLVEHHHTSAYLHQHHQHGCAWKMWYTHVYTPNGQAMPSSSGNGINLGMSGCNQIASRRAPSRFESSAWSWDWSGSLGLSSLGKIWSRLGM